MTGIHTTQRKNFWRKQPVRVYIFQKSDRLQIKILILIILIFFRDSIRLECYMLCHGLRP